MPASASGREDVAARWGGRDNCARGAFMCSGRRRAGNDRAATADGGQGTTEAATAATAAGDKHAESWGPLGAASEDRKT